MVQYCTKIYFVLVLFNASISNSNSQTCSFKYKRDFPDKESVFLLNCNLLTEPENDTLVLNTEDEIIVACPGTKNSLVKTGTKFTLAKCVSDQTLKIGSTNYHFSDLSCSTSITGEYQETTSVCGASKGVIKHIGHYVNDTFFTLFNICYNNDNGEALYADQMIFRSVITYTKIGNRRPCFKVGGLVSEIKRDHYKQAWQIEILEDLLGSSELANEYIYSGSYLARGQLAPDADQVYVTSSYSTYFYMNTVPQWQQINNGNWKSLELSVRRIAINNEEDLQVITGGWQVLQLKDVNNKLVDIYLSGDKLPVPKFIWKVVYSLRTQKGIAFVSVNNPFLLKVTENEYICTDICDTYGWGTINWSDPSKGLLYCCDISELREVIDTIPNFVVTDILEGNLASKVLRRLFGKFGFEDDNGVIRFKEV